MTKLDKYLQLKKRVEAAQQKAAQAEGALNEVMCQLNREFGCVTLDEAKKKLEQRIKQKQSSKEAFDNAIEDFVEKWGDENE